MTKRILAAVLAAVMCLSLLTVNVFAAATNPSITKSGDTGVTVTWTGMAGASYYTVQLLRDNAAYGSAQRVLATATLSYSASNLSGGTYTAVVSTYNAGGILLDTSTTSASVVIPISGGTGNNTITVSGTTGTVKISWNPVSGGTNYEVTYTYTLNGTTYTGLSTPESGKTEVNPVIPTGGVLVSVTITYLPGTGTRTTYGTLNLTGTSTGGASSGNIGLTNGVLSWQSAGVGAYYYVYYYVNGQRGTLTSTPITNTYLNVSSVIQRYGAYAYNLYFQVYTYGNTSVPYATYYYNSGSSGNVNNAYGIYVSIASTTTLNVSWNTASNTNVTHYLVTVAINNGSVVVDRKDQITANGVSMSFRYGYENTVIVQACSGSQILYTVGTATVSPTGQVTYTGGSTTGNTQYPGTWGNTVYGVNCTITINSASNSTVNWTASDSGPFWVLVSPVNGQYQEIGPIYNNYCTIPYGSSASFGVVVFSRATNQRIGWASYTSTTSTNTNSADYAKIKSSVTNLTVAEKSTSSITISWEPVAGASTYEVEYAPLLSTAYQTAENIRTTSYTLNYGKKDDFEAYVWAWVSGVRKSVGSIVHKANDEFPKEEEKKPDSSSGATTKPATPQLSAYVTGFKGTVGVSGAVTLAWNAASGNPSYEVWYKKSSASTWKKLYTTSGRSLKVTKLTDGTSYDFKVVANGRDSGILTITPGTSASTKTAPNPAGSGESNATVPSITSVSGGTGTITVSWEGIQNGNLYRVYIAEGDSTQYRTKTTSWSTSETTKTISGLSAGTYKVRIKASTDGGKTWTSLGDCTARSVTVR